MKRFFLSVILLLAMQIICIGQISRVIDSLGKVSKGAISDSQKVVVLGQLAEYYFLYKLDKKADSCLQMQLTLAELSNNNNILIEALFGDAITNSGSAMSQETRDRIVHFTQKGIDYAKAKNDDDYLALAFTRMSFIQLKSADVEKALSYATLALSSTHNVRDDSIVAVVYIQLGDVYQAKSESEEAFRNYANAFDIAQKIDNIDLQSLIYHKFSEIYKSLRDPAKASEYLNESLKLNTDNNNFRGMVQDYIDIIRLKDDTLIIHKALDVCRVHNLPKYSITLKRLMLAVYMVKVRNATQALAYLNGNEELKNSYLNISTSHYYRTVGDIFRYSCIPDSAIYYYNLAKPELTTKYGNRYSSIIFSELAACYSLKNQYDSAIYYFEKTLDIAKRTNSVAEIEAISDSLSNMYALNGEYQLSYVYGKQSKIYKDILNKLASDKDIARAEVDRQRKLHELAVQAELERVNRVRNLQYMAITIAITVVFVLFIFLGMFPISKMTIKIFGYFFFISVFEFIVLLIDNFIGRITHHEPLKIWLIKIFLIAMLVPCQHFLEHGLIRFLSSRKLLEARQKMSIKKWWKNVKKPVPGQETDIEEDTAVL